MRQGKTITDIIENVRARAKTAKYESATPHLVSELVTYIENLIDQIGHALLPMDNTLDHSIGRVVEALTA